MDRKRATSDGTKSRSRIIDLKFSRRDVLAATGTTALASLAGCSGVIGGSTDTVTFGSLPLATVAPVLIAEEKGFFADRNIELERERIGGVPLATPKLASGDLDVAAGSIGASVFNSIAQDVPIRIVADFAKHYPKMPSAARLWAREGIYSEDATFDDLVATNDGTLTVAHNAKGGSLDYILGRILDISNAGWEDVTVKEIQFSDMIPAMLSNEIDAAIAPDPLGLALASNANAGHVVYASAVLPRFQMAGYFYGGPFMENRSDVAVRWLEALILGIREYYEMGSYPNDEVASLVNEAFDINKQAIKSSVPALPHKNGAVNVDSLARQQEYHSCRGNVEETVSRDKFHDVELRTKALDAVGKLEPDEAEPSPDLLEEWGKAAPRPYHPIGESYPLSNFPNDSVCR